MRADGVVIVGAGHAAGTLAAGLRQGGYTAPVCLIGAEPLPPYQRPPLSKAWLKGEADPAGLLLRPASFYAEHHIDLRLSTRVAGIDRAAARVRLENGETIPYEHLVLATGSTLRRLAVPGIDSDGIFELRTEADAQALRARLGPGVRLAVVGGGYIGLEVAATARGLGAEVVIIEREQRLLARVASQTLSAFFADFHRTKGVTLMLAASVTGFSTTAGKVSGVILASDETVACDLALVGIGALANDALALDAGLVCRDGIVVDEHAVTSDPAIFAIGDCTQRPMARYGRSVRLESVPNALEQARQVVARLCGKPTPAAEAPWFWSEQYDLRLQIAGLSLDVAKTVVRGDPASARFAVFHLDADNRLQALEAVNSPAEFAAARQWVSARQVIDPARAADAALSVKQIIELVPGAA